ncbi:MAG: hypothetical protein ACKO6N_04245 [Myxococcota bacterium]
MKQPLTAPLISPSSVDGDALTFSHAATSPEGVVHDAAPGSSASMAPRVARRVSTSAQQLQRLQSNQGRQRLLQRQARPSSQSRVVQRAPLGPRVQRTIKEDLLSAVEGLGTDEDKIWTTLENATEAERQSVLADVELMQALADDLSYSEQVKMLDLLKAPLKKKLELSISGWWVDEAYAVQAAAGASAEDQLLVADDSTFLATLEPALGASHMIALLTVFKEPIAKVSLAVHAQEIPSNQVLLAMVVASPEQRDAIYRRRSLTGALSSRYTLPELSLIATALNNLAEELKFLINLRVFQGAGLVDYFRTAPIDKLKALMSTPDLLASAEGSMDVASKYALHGMAAGRIFREGADTPAAYVAIDHELRTIRQQMLNHAGTMEEQRALLDAVVVLGADLNAVKRSFESYWEVDLKLETTSDGKVASEWDIPTLQAIHDVLKRLPARDVRDGNFSSILRLIDSTGGYMTDGGEFGMGENVTPTDTARYGSGTTLTAAAAQGSKVLKVTDASIFAVGETVALNDRSSPDKSKLTRVDTSKQELELETALTADYPEYTLVVPDDDSAAREISWLAAVVMHEIGHSVDTALGGVTGFTGLGGWWVGDDFDTWVTAMDGWKGSDGKEPTAEEKTSIKEVIVNLSKTNGGTPINAGLSRKHALNKYLSKGVPVIDAARYCLEAGDSYWYNPQNILARKSKRFAINTYYNKFQYYNEEVHSQRVRDYSVYSPAEFFAENYAVFYEEASPTLPEDQLGRLLPVSGWRDWIRNNVHNRGMAPVAGGTAAALPSPSVGKKAGNPGR